MDNDQFLYDIERLYSIASSELIKQGLAYFTENRVIALDKENERLIAQVEDADEEIYWVALSLAEDGTLFVDCDCNTDHSVCNHAIAALYSYANQYAEDAAGLGTAVEEAIQERVKKGRNEVKVKLLSGNLGFGTWQATSMVSATHWQRSYQVQIRSLDQRMNYCTCPDLASNRLGTCKHIEAVLHYAKKSPEYQSFKDRGFTLSFVYLAWESATRPVIRLQRCAQPEGSLARLFSEFFNQQDVFNGRLPEDFFRFSQQIYGRDDFLLGDDVMQYVQQCAEDAAQSLRGREISRIILQSNGVLPGIKVRLFPYQSEGVAFLASRGRALLADDMGLGKTLQAITAACWLTDNVAVNRVLIVCPASLKHQWAREIAKFTDRSVQIIQGSAENRTVQYRADALFFIINYELILRDLSIISETLKPDLLILDEAQRIKNWRTKLASTVKQIPSRYVFVLTGTPLENRLEDLYSLLQMVDSRVLGPLWRCLMDFHITDERGKVIGYRNLSELRRRIAPVVLRRNRTLVSDQLPDRTEVILDIAMNDKQVELHDSALSAAGLLATLAKKRPLTPSEQNRLMAALQQARMACNAAGLVDKETQGSPKLDELARLLDELCVQSNRKAVVFSQWALMTDMVETLVRSMGLGFVHLHGGIPTQKRGELMEKFQHDDAIQVFISTDAGGVGLNLQSATVLINLDMPWNPAILDQRIARIHRLGQKQNVQIFLLLAEDSYEQHVAKLVKGKRELFDNVIDPNASEDIVGVSKKMLETLIDDLADLQKSAAKSEPSADSTAIPSQEHTEEFAHTKTTDAVDEQDDEIKRLIEKIQITFGHRIERILARSGSLLAVVEHCQESDEQAALDISSEQDIPFAVIDVRTLRSLQRLGHASPLSEARVVFEPITPETPPENPLLTAAMQKLRSAEILLNQHCSAGVIDLLASAIVLKVTALSGQTQTPPLATVAVWLYSEIVPQNRLTLEQAALVLQVTALNQSPNVPEALIQQIYADVQQLFAVLG
ncbi:MAG: DEAD/DEAH box helicase [Methylococcales bacterium]|nr:DEAD/DEAH box helicase [Methylococcales bacterium]